MEDPEFNRIATASDFDLATPPQNYSPELAEKALSIVVLGASGDLAKKKTFPALFTLFLHGLLPPTTSIVGYARSAMTVAQLQERVAPFLPKESEAEINAFFGLISYVPGAYDDTAAF